MVALGGHAGLPLLFRNNCSANSATIGTGFYNFNTPEAYYFFIFNILGFSLWQLLVNNVIGVPGMLVR